MKIKELKQDHPRIYELAMLRQKEAGNYANDELELYCGGMDGGFFWGSSKEGLNFWSGIYRGNYDLFYQKYPHTNDLPLINPNMLDPDLTQDLTREAIEQDEVESEISGGISCDTPIKPEGYDERMNEFCKNQDLRAHLTAQINWNNKDVNPATGRRYDDPNEIEWAKKWQPADEPINWNKITENYNKVEDMFNIEPNASRQFDTGSKRDNDDNKPLVNHIDPYTRLRFGHLLRAGATKYGINNWRLGQPTETALESLHRHLAKFELNLKNGIDQDEDHIMSCIFNLQLIAMNEEKEGITVDHFYKKK